MTFESFILDIVQIYLDMIRSDLNTMDHWWMWLPFLIPGALYILWMLVKYTVVTGVLIALFWLMLAAIRVLLVEVIQAFRSKK